MYKLVIFDLDGTLLNTLGDLADAGNFALTQMGFPVYPVDAYRHFVGNGIPNLIHRILPDNHTDEQHKQCYDIFTEYYSLHKADKTAPYDGIKDLLHKLNEQGILCCVNTNKAHEFSCELIKAAFGDDIRDVIGYGIGFPAKPDPSAACEFINRYKVSKADVLYVGDSNVDMKTARAAEIDNCAVLWGFRDYEELSACSPKHIVNTASELYNVITK